jgi:DNA-binding response OmpR family regulator
MPASTGHSTRLLLVEDDAAICRLVVNVFEEHAVDVTTATTAAAALTALDDAVFEVAILDLGLPDGSGLDVMAALRDRGSATHVIILSARAREFDRVRALELGADDYVVKPFFARELTARVLAVRRRQATATNGRLQYGRIAIDLAARQMTVDDAPVALRAKEFDLLAFLAARPRRAFSREELLRSVWQSATEWQKESTVTEHVRRLRSKIEDDPLNPRLLQTVRGVGYRFDPTSVNA